MRSSIGFPEEHIISCLNESFTKQKLQEALKFVNENSPDPKNATVVFWFESHGSCGLTGGAPVVGHSYSMIRREGTTNENPDWDDITDAELDSYLDRYDFGKLLVHITSCESGCYAAQDTTGKLHGATDDLYTSCGGANRIVITDSTAPLLAWGGDSANGFWKDGLVGGEGDTAPTGNRDGKTSVEEAWFYYKSLGGAGQITPIASQPCMNDQYPVEDPEKEMFL